MIRAVAALCALLCVCCTPIELQRALPQPDDHKPDDRSSDERDSAVVLEQDASDAADEVDGSTGGRDGGADGTVSDASDGDATAVDAGGEDAGPACQVDDVEPVGAPTVTLEWLPGNGALVPRAPATNTGTVHIAGTVTEAGWRRVAVEVKRAGAFDRAVVGLICAGAFTVDVPITAELAAYDIAVSIEGGERTEPIAKLTDIVAGDVALLMGQSNTTAMRGPSVPFMTSFEQSPWVRSFGSRAAALKAVMNFDDQWHYAEGDVTDGPGAIGQWALRGFHQTALATGIPVAVINGGYNGILIQNMDRNASDPDDTSKYFGRIGWRIDKARLRESVRVAMWWQGESNADVPSPYGPAEYAAMFARVHGWVLEDYPNIELFYVTQTRRGTSAGLDARLPDVIRRLPETLPVKVIGTNGLDGHDGLHFRYTNGYQQYGDWVSRTLRRDFYGETAVADTDPINVVSASYASNVIKVVLDSDASAITIDAGAAANFVITGAARTIAGLAIVDGNLEVSLTPGAGAPTGIEYWGHAESGPWIKNINGVGLLSFILPVE
jgi:hypothetical protein